MAPSVHIAPYTGNRAGPNLFIRGMGALATQITKDYATAIYIDDVPVGPGGHPTSPTCGHLKLLHP